MKKIILTLIVLAVIGGGAAAYFMKKTTPEPVVTTAQLTRGDVVDSVQATGTLAAVETVDVGTQVSGTVESLYADFNDIVKKGQVIARLDPSLLQTQIDQQRANVTRAEADLERLRVNLADAKRKLDQAKMMWDKQLIPKDQLDTAELNVKTQDASIRSSEAGLSQTKSQLNTAMVNLSHTVIRAPITGIVIMRSVDVGQTVQASTNAPTLYILAEDLTQMEVLANIDETDVGRIRPGQNVSFRVDAYPTDSFVGVVKQVRLQPTTVQNVVTYSTVISVPNPDFRLKPGMTASPLTIEIMRKDNVLRAPAAALRFRPTNDIFAALKQDVPPEMQRGGGRGVPGAPGAPGASGGGNRGAGFDGASRQPSATPPAAAGTPPASGAQRPPAAGSSATPPSASDQGRGRRDQAAQGGGDSTRAGGGRGGDRAEGGQGGGRGSGNMTPEQRAERQKQMEERMKNMTPEERERMQARMREGGGRGGGGRDGGSGGGRGNAPGTRTGGDRAAGATQGQRTRPAPAPAKTVSNTTATTIDQLFPMIAPTEGRGRVWMFITKQLKSVAVRTGISDGTWIEIIETPETTAQLKEGTEVVTNVVTGLEPRPGQQGTGTSPLMPQRGQPGRGGPGGGGQGGGGRGGR